MASRIRTYSSVGKSHTPINTTLVAKQQKQQPVNAPKLDSPDPKFNFDLSKIPISSPDRSSQPPPTINPKLDNKTLQKEPHQSESNFQVSPLQPKVARQHLVSAPWKSSGLQQLVSGEIDIQRLCSECEKEQATRKDEEKKSSRKGLIQPKLTIGQPRDKYEQEAGRVAAQVVQQINAPRPQQSASSQTLQRKEISEEEKESEDLQTKIVVSNIQRQEESPKEEKENQTQMKLQAGILQLQEQPAQEEKKDFKKWALGRPIKQKNKFQYFLKEGARIIEQAKFGLVGGGKGRDPRDAYDSRYWKEGPPGTIQALIPAWEAMDKMFKNIDKEVPKAGGGKTRWSFDCLEASQLLRLYAIWRMTPSKKKFNQTYNPLKLGIKANTPVGLGKTFYCDGPKKPAYKIIGGDPKYLEGDIVYLSKSINQIAIDAPVGALVTFSNNDIIERCNTNRNQSICEFRHENTIKMGKNQFFAHPFGVVDLVSLVSKWAEVAGVRKKDFKTYIMKNI